GGSQHVAESRRARRAERRRSPPETASAGRPSGGFRAGPFADGGNLGPPAGSEGGRRSLGAAPDRIGGLGPHRRGGLRPAARAGTASGPAPGEHGLLSGHGDSPAQRPLFLGA